MGDLSKNFNRSEFACRGEKCCGGSAPVDPVLVEALQDLRDRVKQPIHITSGFRCIKHNAAIGGAEDSQHTLGKAADVRVVGMSPVDLAEAAKKVRAFANGGIGLYGAWVHLDVRSDGPVRWRGV